MIIGVTGGIGSGKSTFIRAVEQLWGKISYDCDAKAKRMAENNAKVREKIAALFGEEAYKDGAYQTRYVAEQVFANTDKLQQLNAIVHPALRRNIARWVKGKKCVLVESAILFQAKLDDMCSAFVVITAPEDVRVERVVKRAEHNGQAITAEQVRQRIRAQQDELPLAQQSGKPVLVVDNNGELSGVDMLDKFNDFMIHNCK